MGQGFCLLWIAPRATKRLGTLGQLPGPANSLAGCTIHSGVTNPNRGCGDGLDIACRRRLSNLVACAIKTFRCSLRSRKRDANWIEELGTQDRGIAYSHDVGWMIVVGWLNGVFRWGSWSQVAEERTLRPFMSSPACGCRRRSGFAFIAPIPSLGRLADFLP